AVVSDQPRFCPALAGEKGETLLSAVDGLLTMGPHRRRRTAKMTIARRPFRASLAAALLGAAGVLAACQGGPAKHLAPVPPKPTAKMKQLGMSEPAPVHMRVFKEESLLEVWKQRKDGQYALLASYPICNWSGKLGPKIKGGDRQAPEGFYTVT